MRGKVRYKQPNGIKVEMYWKYNDYRREMSVLEYNDYNLKVHFDWLIKVMKHTFRYGRRNYPISQQTFHIEEGKYIIPKKVKREVIREDGSSYDVYEDKITKEEYNNNMKVMIKEEANSRIRNVVKKKKQNNVISTLIGISDSVVYGSILGVPSYFAESMDVMRNKWYVEKVHFRYRDYENPTVGSEEGLSWKELLYVETKTYSSLVDLTDYIFRICSDWCDYNFVKGLEKYYKPIKLKHQIEGLKHLELITKKLGEDYISYLNRIKNENEKEDDKMWVWNDEFEELFNEVTKK